MELMKMKLNSKYSLLDNVNRLNIDYEYNNKSCLGIIP